MVVELVLAPKGGMVLRNPLGKGKLDNVDFEIGFAPPCTLYVEAEGRIVSIDKESFVREALKLIKENKE